MNHLCLFGFLVLQGQIMDQSENQFIHSSSAFSQACSSSHQNEENDENLNINMEKIQSTLKATPKKSILKKRQSTDTGNFSSFSESFDQSKMYFYSFSKEFS